LCIVRYAAICSSSDFNLYGSACNSTPCRFVFHTQKRTLGKVSSPSGIPPTWLVEPKPFPSQNPSRRVHSSEELLELAKPAQCERTPTVLSYIPSKGYQGIIPGSRGSKEPQNTGYQPYCLLTVSATSGVRANGKTTRSARHGRAQAHLAQTPRNGLRLDSTSSGQGIKRGSVPLWHRSQANCPPSCLVCHGCSHGHHAKARAV